MELEHPDPVHEGRRRVLITGAGGQLGRALQQEFVADDVLALSHADWDVATPPSGQVSQQVSISSCTQRRGPTWMEQRPIRRGPRP